jgi:glycerol-3-phosphate dehydrogenase (NAD(P)+)
MTTIAILGDGPLARAVLRVAKGGGVIEMRLFAPNLDPGDAARACPDIASAVDGAKAVLFAGATAQLAETADAYGAHATPDQIVLLPARGVRAGFELPLTTIRNRTCIRKVGIIGGPLHVRELDADHHVNAVIATRFPEVWSLADHMIDPNRVTLHRSRDVVGVQVAGVYSHIASLVAGMARALEISETARGVLLAQSLSEARRLALSLGADERTFGSVAGLGELIPRPSGGSDRHLEVGARLGRGAPLGDATADIEAEVEGLGAAEEAERLAEQRGLEVPVASAVVRVAAGRASAKEAIHALLRRPLPGAA